MLDVPAAPRADPTRRLAPRARVLWTVGALTWGVPLAVLPAVVLGGVGEVSDGLRLVVSATAFVVALTGVFVVPALRVRRWRWEVRDEELDLRRGAFTEVRTIVPMARVQHVDVRRSGLQRAADLADVVVHTAAGQSTIPMLPEADAVEVRDRIADLARTPDEL